MNICWFKSIFLFLIPKLQHASRFLMHVKTLFPRYYINWQSFLSLVLNVYFYNFRSTLLNSNSELKYWKSFHLLSKHAWAGNVWNVLKVAQISRPTDFIALFVYVAFGNFFLFILKMENLSSVDPTWQDWPLPLLMEANFFFLHYSVILVK